MSGEEETYVGSGTQEKKTNANERDIDKETDPAADATLPVEVGSVVGSSHTDVSDTPEDEAEE